MNQPPDPTLVSKTRDGTFWVRFDHVDWVEWKRMAGHTPKGIVVLPCLAFEIDERDLEDELVRRRSIVYRRRSSRLYVSTDYLSQRFPDFTPALDDIRDTVRRVVNLAVAAGYTSSTVRPSIGSGG